MSPTKTKTYLPEGVSFQSISSLTLAEWNPRLIKTSDFQELLKSLREDPSFLLERFPLVADGPEFQAGGIIYAGNRRAQAVQFMYENEAWEPPAELQQLGWLVGTIPVSVRDIPEKIAKKRAIQDNAHEGEWVENDLAEMLAELEGEGIDLNTLGLSSKELELLLPKIDDDPLPPDGFADLTNGVATNTTCPKCGFQWQQSGQAVSDNSE